MDNEKLAVELLKEIKMSAKRWFMAFCIMVVVELLTIGGFLWYISLPIEEYTTSYDQVAEDIDNSEVTQTIGGKQE